MTEGANRASIEAFRAREMSAANRGDVEALVALRAEDFVALPPNQPAVEGLGAFREWIGGLLQQLEWDWSLVSDEVIVAGAWAVDRGTYEAVVRPKGSGDATQDLGKYVWVLRRDGDSWKLAVAIWNSSLARDGG